MGGGGGGGDGMGPVLYIVDTVVMKTCVKGGGCTSPLTDLGWEREGGGGASVDLCCLSCLLLESVTGHGHILLWTLVGVTTSVAALPCVPFLGCW